jgi:hypothetical protein
MAVDGVTVNGSSLLLYTVSKGDMSLFTNATKLGSLVHVKEAEIDDCVAKLERVRKNFGDVTTLSVDNAARLAMKETTKEYAKKNPSARPILPDHSIDLLAKDSPKVPCFMSVMGDVDEINDLLSTDRVDGILEKLFMTGKLERFTKVTSFSQNRFNKSATYLESMLLQKQFLDIIRDVEDFKVYYESRTVPRKAKIDMQINIAGPQFWERIKLAICWFKPIEHEAPLPQQHSHVRISSDCSSPLE